MIYKNLLILLLVFGIAYGCANNRSENDGEVSVYLTTSDLTFDFERQSTPFGEVEASAGVSIVLDPAQRYQEMDGFGAAITGSSCYNLLQMDPVKRSEFLTKVFSHELGMGYSYIRIAIGCSDFSLSEFTCCDTPGIENFALPSEDLEYVIPVLKEILEINPTIKILGSPWTPPRWMKVNNLTELEAFNSWTSGHLNPAYYEDYARYFVKWIEAYGEHGIAIYSITPQNEPLNRGNSVSLFMGWDEQRDFVKKLGPALLQAGLDTKIYLFDHNYNYDNMEEQEDYPIKIYQDTVAAKYVAGAAYHNYGGRNTELNQIHDLAPEKELIFTETSIGTWNDGQNLAVRLIDDMNELGMGTINKWSKAVIVWNLMLDSDRGPNRPGGCTTCYGAVDIDANDYETISYNSHYYVIGHLSSVVKPGAIRIGSTSNSDDSIVYSAFENIDGTYAMVLLNKGTSDRTISVNDGAKSFSYLIPAKAVASFQWANGQ